MKGLQVKTRSNRAMEPKMSRFIFLSLLLHLGALSLLLFVPDFTSTRKMSGPTVYEVNLVNLPAAKPRASAKSVQPERTTKKVSSSKKSVEAKRISTPQKNEKPVIIGKRTVERKKSTP
ncbi:MAG: hypothetical protein GY846_14710, partial [Deltaproteobacteria bacterium]|nr:hypothetical protein [Deltaproteobacteria bacterium]